MGRSKITTCVSLLLMLGLFAPLASVTPAAARPVVSPAAPQEEPGLPRQPKATTPGLAAAKQDGFISYKQPSEILLNTIARKQLGAQASQAQIETTAKQLLEKWNTNNYHGPDPKAYQKLVRNENRALAANSSPAAMGLAVTGTLRLFAVAVEFAGTDVLTDSFSHPISVDDRTCITDTAGLAFTGPLHNQIPAPGPRDNFSGWRSSYERDYYQKLVFSTEGITERLRPDLTDPEDGKPGIDVSGQTMRNYYNEVSGGRVKFDGGPRGIVGWVQLPHSEAYYGASACFDGEAGDIASMEGLPNNPSFGNGPSQLFKDLVDQINATDPTFPWKDYDTDGDGVLDHVVAFHAGKDKSAGGGKQGYQAIWAHRGSVVDNGKIGYVVSNGGTPNDPKDDIEIGGYTMQYEDVETGVLVHEFGHDLGLPDLYDIARQGESNTDAWDLMSLGSNTGKLIGVNPTNMSAWDKYALGWTDPKVISPTADLQDVLLGQTSQPPAGSTQAVRVNLPPTQIVLSELPEGSTQAWWTGNDQSWADVRLARTVDLTAQTQPISISFDLDLDTEEDWDYLFLEASADGGQTYTQLKGYEVGTDDELTTPDDYADPNGRLKDYGGLKHGYTGFSGGYLRVYHDLSPYAGKTITLRFRYATDAALEQTGAFIDNISITSAKGVILNDPVEGNNANGWTPTVGTFDQSSPLGAGWTLSDGVQLAPKYYLLEWRNAVGFDKGLQYSYHTVFSELTPDGRDEFYVDHTRSNVPGMLVWLRDTRFGQEPFGTQGGNNILDSEGQFVEGPSEGAKGGLLIVDANPTPIRGPRGGTITTDYGTYAYPPANNWRGRVQSLNSAFNLQSTPTFTVSIASGAANPATTVITATKIPALPAVAGFHDALGYYPGIEELPQPVTTFEGQNPPETGPFITRIKKYAFSDADASVVVPAKDYYPPRTPAGFTGKGGETAANSASVSTFETLYSDGEATTGINELVFPDNFFTVNVGGTGGTDVVGQHSGNPGSDDLQYGYHFVVTGQARDGSTGSVRIYNSMSDAQAQGQVSPIVGTNPVTITATAENTGSPRAVVLYSDFDETQATYVPGSATNGAIPVTAAQPTVAEIVRTQGIAGLASVRAQNADEVRAVVLYPAGALDSGATASFAYRVTPKANVHALKVSTFALGQGISNQNVAQSGTFVYLPQVGKSR